MCNRVLTPRSSAAPVAQTPPPEKANSLRNVNHDLPRDVPSIRWAGNLQHVEGVAESFECTSKPPRLHVTVNTKEMVFTLGDPKGIIVRNGSKNSFEMQCGHQKPFQVGIFYIPSDKPAGVDGAIRELVF